MVCALFPSQLCPSPGDGVNLGPSWGSLGSTWGHLEVRWSQLAAVLGLVGAISMSTCALWEIYMKSHEYQTKHGMHQNNCFTFLARPLFCGLFAPAAAAPLRKTGSQCSCHATNSFFLTGCGVGRGRADCVCEGCGCGVGVYRTDFCGVISCPVSSPSVLHLRPHPNSTPHPHTAPPTHPQQTWRPQGLVFCLGFVLEFVLCMVCAWTVF